MYIFVVVGHVAELYLSPTYQDNFDEIRAKFGTLFIKLHLLLNLLSCLQTVHQKYRHWSHLHFKYILP